MGTILEASVKLFAEDSQLRASFQGLAPQAHLAGTTVGDRFAEGMRRSAAKAHERFFKDFVGPLQSRDMAVANRPVINPADQYRASDLAVHKGIVTAVQSHGQAMAMSGQKAEAWNLSVREATQSARLFAGTIAGSLNPQLGAMVMVGGEAIRALKGMGVAIAGIGSGVAIGAIALGFYIERVKQVVDAKARLDAAIFRKDPAAASAEVAKRTAELDDLVSKKAQASQRTGTGLAFGLFGERGRSFQEMIAFFSVFGKKVEEKRAEVRESLAEDAKLFREVTFPQIDAKAGVEGNQLLIQQIGLQRQSAQTIEDLVDSTQRLRAAKFELVEATIKEMDVTERAKAQNIFDAATKRGAPVAQDVQDKILGDITRRQNNLRAAARTQDAEDVRQANSDRVAIEERQRAHAIELGRISMAEQLKAERAATMDVSRTVQEREEAEKKVFHTRRSMAESYFAFQSQLTGKSFFKEQIEVARGFMSELVSGSAAWFAQVSKVSDLFVRMREEAKGIFSQQVSIAIGEKDRAMNEQDRLDALKKANVEDERIVAGGGAGPTTTAKDRQAAQERIAARASDERARLEREDAGKISINDIPSFLDRARRRDEAALGGARVAPGDLSAAVGRVDLFRKMDREGLSPREAFSRLTEDPSKHLARAIEGLTGGASETTPVLTGLADAAALATRALLGLAGASPRQGSAQPGQAESQRGGPALSEDNRQAIMDAIATRMTDEKLAVYGRR